MEEWKNRGKDVFFAANGDSDLARNRVAAFLRAYFLQLPNSPETVSRWAQGFQGTETVELTPPKVTASNSAYVDWLYIADYVLLACASQSERLEAENQLRETEFQSVMNSYNLRLVVHEARQMMKADPAATDDGILQVLKATQPNASLANVKEARKLEKSNARFNPPVMPLPAKPMQRYTALYF